MTVLVAQNGAEAFDWATEFRPFTLFHAVTTAACIAVIAAATILGVRWRGTPRETFLRRAWAWLVLGGQVVLGIYFLWPPFDVQYSLPLHICDVAGWISAFAMLTDRRWLRVILYYWGIVLSTQAFLTPVLHGHGSGFATPNFWAFWGLHVMIVGSAVYDIVVHRFRPTWRDFRTAVLFTASYTAAIFVLNIILKTNYVYVGNLRPLNPTIIDRLGDWPLRVVWLGLIVTAGFALFTAVWPTAWKPTPGLRADPPAA